MRYNDPLSQSAEYLRLVIPLLSKHKLAPNPLNYAVMYEYVSGANEKLKQEIDTFEEAGETISDSVSERLFFNYVSEFDDEKMTQVGAGIRRVLESLVQTTTNAGNQAASFNQSLEKYGEQLKSGVASVSLEKIVRGLTSDTNTMQQSVSVLKEQLEESQDEVGNLRHELERVRTEAVTDPLTGLVNRNGLANAFESALKNATASSYNLCLLMIDIDHFKKLNDSYGHLLGDKVIKFIADLIKQRVKGKDTAARFGGEEFIVLLPDTPIDGAYTVAEDIRQSIEKSRIKRSSDSQPIGEVTVSIGVAQYYEGESIDEFTNRADSALYKSKNNGRNRVTIDQRNSCPT